MIIKPIKTQKIYKQIVDQIGQLVAEGQLKPGDRLPSERELVERFQVSRASIREAISALEMISKSVLVKERTSDKLGFCTHIVQKFNRDSGYP